MAHQSGQSRPRIPLRKVVQTSAGAVESTSVETDDFHISVVRFGKGRLPVHRHERACLSIVLAGAFAERIGKSMHECHVATTLVKPAEEPHDDRFAGSTQLIIEPASGWVGAHRHSPFHSVHSGPNGVALSLALRAARELSHRDLWVPLAVEGLALEIVAVVGRQRSRGTPRRPAPRWLTRVQQRLHEERERPTLRELALEADVHPGYLSRVFRARFGTSVGEYTRLRRLERAADTLTTEERSLSAVALLAGFADQSHFTRAFRAHYGVTPGQYRLEAVGRKKRS